jgi:hypothetical protein
MRENGSFYEHASPVPNEETWSSELTPYLIVCVEADIIILE